MQVSVCQGTGGDVVEDAALAVEGAGAGGAVRRGLAVVDGFDLAAVFGGAEVVELGDQGEPYSSKGMPPSV